MVLRSLQSIGRSLGTLAVLAALLVVVWLVVGAAVTFAWIAGVMQ